MGFEIHAAVRPRWVTLTPRRLNPRQKVNGSTRPLVGLAGRMDTGVSLEAANSGRSKPCESSRVGRSIGEAEGRRAPPPHPRDRPPAEPPNDQHSAGTLA